MPASFHSVRQLSRALQNRIRRFEVKPKNERAEGSEKNRCFSIFVHLKSACSGALLSEIEIVISPQFVGFSARKSPFQGGRLPRGSKLVLYIQKKVPQKFRGNSMPPAVFSRQKWIVRALSSYQDPDFWKNIQNSGSYMWERTRSWDRISRVLCI